jgi:hypothetical protein
MDLVALDALDGGNTGIGLKSIAEGARADKLEGVGRRCGTFPPPKFPRGTRGEGI